MKSIFFSRSSFDGVVSSPRDFSAYSLRFWRPLGTSIVPHGLPSYPYAIWSLFHHLRLFSNEDYGILLAFSGREIVHRSVVTPRYFRFPFMDERDLQIGDVWTHPRCRSRGLASYVLKKVVERKSFSGRKFWYLAEEGNIGSIKVAEKAGFVRRGEGVRTKRLGLNLLGAFEIKKTYGD